VIFSVKVVPGSSRTAIAGVLGGMLKVKIAAPPEKGKANQALIEFLARRLGARRNVISLISGRTGPVKKVRISGVTGEMVVSRLSHSG